MDVGNIMGKRDISDQIDDAFTINLQKNHGQSARVASVEIEKSDIRNLYMFKTDMVICDVFTKDVAAQISEVLSRAISNKQTMILPDFEIVTSGAIISGLTIRISYLDNGVATITMCFGRYVGAIKSMFRFDPSMPLESATIREKIAVEVLKDIMTPLMDVLSFVENAAPDDLARNRSAIENRLGKLSSRAEELSFYSGLLQRYVAGCKADAEQKKTMVENLDMAI